MRKSGMIAKGLIAVAMVLLSHGARAETLIVTTNLPPVHWGSTQGAEPFMKCVKEATNNAIDFNYFPSSQISDYHQSLDAVNNGIAQISYIVVSAQTDKLPLNGISMLPEMGDSTVEMTVAYRKVLDGSGPIAQEFARNNIHPLLINMFPPYQMLSRTEPFDTPEKIQGKKIGSGGGSLIFTLDAIGAKAIEIAPGDLYLALQQGTIDGTMLALASVKPYRLQEVVKSMSSNGHFGSAAGVWSIDLKVWKRLSPDHQKAMTDCGLKVEVSLAKWADKLTDDLGAEFQAGGVNVFKFSPAAQAAIDKQLNAAREQYIARLTARGLPAQEAYKEYLAALGK